MIQDFDTSLYDGIELIPNILDNNTVISSSGHASEDMCLSLSSTQLLQSLRENIFLNRTGSHHAFIFSEELSIGSSLRGIFHQNMVSENVVLHELKKSVLI